jgi:drug/metabolite transporter (DMT)-like permease
MFTTTENRSLTANVFGWLSVVIGSVASLAVVAALIFRAVHGLDRQSDGGLAFASVAALLAFIIGGPSGCYSWFLRRGRLGVAGVVLCLVPLAACLFVRWFSRGQSY